jgi:pyrophosphatase PpaX
MPRYRAVLFDLDGTLLDSVRLILDSYHHTLAAHGLPPRSDEDWLDGIGTPLVAQFSEWSSTPDQLAALVETYRDYNLRNHDARVAAYPGVIDMVESVRGRGVRTALVTSKNRSGALRGLERIGLVSAMECIIGADDVTLHKPHPEPVLRALESLEVAPAEAVFVGDSVHDMTSGRAAGTATAAVLWGPFDRLRLEPTAPDHWLSAPADLLTILG